MMNVKKIFAGVTALCIVGGVMPPVDVTEDNVVITANAEDTIAEQNGFTQSEIDNSEIKPHIYAESKLITLDEKANKQSVNIMVEGADLKYSTVAFHIYYDPRLTLCRHILGYPDVVAGNALTYLTQKTPLEDPTAEEQGMKGVFVQALADADYGMDGVMYTLTFELPENAVAGDVFPIDIYYKSRNGAIDYFTNRQNDDEGKLMQAYAFTRGINNGITSSFDAEAAVGAEGLEKCPNILNVDPSTDGVIAIIGENTTTTTQATTTAETTTTTTTAPSEVKADLTYEVYDDYVEITGCNKDATSAVIPAEIEGLPATKIGSRAFDNCSSLKSVTIPDSVTEIGYGAFLGCASLESITIPDSVTEIGGSAFEDCSNLKSVTIPDSVTKINYYAFKGCSSLTNIKIPNSVTYIGSSAFYGCTSLESIIIPDSVTAINYDTFSYCSGLTDITIENPACEIDDSAETISNGSDENGEYYFNGTIHGYSNSVVQEYADKYNYKFVSIGEAVATYEDLTYEMHVDYAKITGCNENATEIVIPDKVDGLPVTKIDSGAFSGCSSLTSITIPESVTYIGGGFSDGCTALTEINVDEKNTVYYSYDGVLYKYAYQEISYYEEDDSTTYNTLLVYPMGKQGKYTIKDGTEKIGAYAFEGCAGLTAVNIPESVTSICCEAFGNCTSLTSVNIAGSIDKEMVIALLAFYGCTSLNYINIPFGVTEIGQNAFGHCTSLTSMDISASVTSIGECFSTGCTSLEEINVDEENTVYYSYDGVLYKNWETREYNTDAATGPYPYEVKTYKTLLACPEGKQGGCTVKDGTEKIARCSFGECIGITDIYIPNTVTYINDEAFINCTSLMSINIPASVTFIGEYFCDGCIALTEINVDEENTVYYSYDGVLYKNRETPEYNSDTDSYEPTIYKVLIACPEGKQGKYTIKDGTDCIRADAFEDCAYLESVSIPESIITIGGGQATISNGYEETIEYDYYHHRDYYFNGTIYGYENSASQIYADYCGYNFVAITSESNTTTSTSGSVITNINSTVATEVINDTVTTTAKYFAPIEDMCEMAVKDYKDKNNITSAKTESTENDDGTVSIYLKDEKGEVLDIYVIDPETGKGTNSANEEVNLPQTGNNSPANLLAILSSIAMVISGLFITFKSGKIRKKEEK